MHRLICPLTKSVGGVVRAPLPSQGQTRNNVSLALPLPYHLRFESEASKDREISSASSTSRSTLDRRFFESVRTRLRPNGRRKDVVQQFQSAVEERHIAALYDLYDELREAAFQSLRASAHPESHVQSQDISQLKATDIRAAMNLLLKENSRITSPSIKGKQKQQESSKEWSGTPSVADGRLVQRMFRDMTDVFGFAIEPIDYQNALASAALLGGSAGSACRYIKQFQKFFPTYSITWEDGMVVMVMCQKEEDVNTAEKVWGLLIEAKVEIHKDLRDLFLRILLRGGDVEQAKYIATEGPSENRLFPLSRQDTTSLTGFLESICRAGQGDWSQAAEIAEHLEQRFQKVGSSSTTFTWHSLLIYTGLVKGGKAAMELVDSKVKQGLFKANEKTFALLLLCQKDSLKQIARNGSEEEVMTLFARIENTCNVKPDLIAFSIGISHLLGRSSSLLYRRKKLEMKQDQTQQVALALGVDSAPVESLPFKMTVIPNVPKYTPGQIHEATLLYQRCRSCGLKPDNATVYPLISAHTNSYVPSLTEAIKLYQDLQSSIEERRAEQMQTRQDREKVSKEMYDMLLYACAKAKDLSMAQKIIQDMNKDGAALNQSNRSNLAILLMNASDTHESAFQMYAQLRDAAVEADTRNNRSSGNSRKSSPFDRHGWLRIIDHFTKLKIDNESLPPVELVLAMSRDMRQHGFSQEALLYSTLLHFYGFKATIKPIQHDIDEIRGAVQAIHLFLQREEEIEPDLVLITALMNSYNRVGYSDAALEIWNRLVLNNTLVDSACIAVVLDTCGRSGKMREARRAWNWVRRRAEQKQHCNKGVWDAWLECLARCRQLPEAIDLVFGEMKMELLERGDSSADAKTMEMLLRFASARHQQWIQNSNEEYPILSLLRRRLQQEMPIVWDQVKSIQIAK